MTREVDKRTGIACLVCDGCNTIFTESQVEEYWDNNSEPESVSNATNADKCESCGQSLYRCALAFPWEDGNNEYAYVRCRYCGHKNIKYGYGEDD